MSESPSAPMATQPSPPRPRPVYKRVWFWLLVVAAIIVLTFAGCAALIVGAVGAGERAAKPTVVGSPEASATESEPPEPSSSDAGAAVGTVDDPAPYGTTLDLGDWTVTVNSVNTETANAEVAGENSFNEGPENGQFALVNVTAAYDGDAEGMAWLELSPRFRGADARVYDTSDGAFAVPPDALSDQPEVTKGGTVSGNVLIDLAPEAIGDKVVVIQGGMFDGTTGVWSAAAQ